MMKDATGIYRNSDLIPVEVTLGEWAAELVERKVAADWLLSVGVPTAERAEASYQQWLRWGQEAHAFSQKGDYQLLFKQLTDVCTESLDAAANEDWQAAMQLVDRKNSLIQRFNEIAGHIPPEKGTK